MNAGKKRLATVLSLMVVSSACRGDTRPTLTAKEYASVQENVAAMQSVGVVTQLHCDTHVAHIERSYWLMTSEAGKQRITIDLAIACGTIEQQAIAYMTLIDNRSGVRLAYINKSGYHLTAP